MVRITEELVRKKSEHNEGIINSLEELSLHQEHVEKIEHLQNWCRDIQILYLQSNLIPKIENLHKLKNLQYLNLALNNIEKVENLERCESLQKLDLTLNFIGDIESVSSLAVNRHLVDLYLTGNPCCDYTNYRNYVIVKVPQLQSLDGKEITRSQRIQAMQIINEVEKEVKQCQKKYFQFREDQKERLKNPRDELDDEEFWKSSSENAPETRREISSRMLQQRNKEKEDESVVKPPVSLFARDGRPLNVNQAKVKIHFCDDDPKQFVLDIAVYKHLDSNLIDVDVQPDLVRVTVKSKIIQYVLPEEVHPDRSTARRSQTTGHLVINMPRVNFKEKLFKIDKIKAPERQTKKKQIQTLEVESKECMDFSKICSVPQKSFKDCSEVPPLEYL